MAFLLLDFPTTTSTSWLETQAPQRACDSHSRCGLPFLWPRCLEPIVWSFCATCSWVNFHPIKRALTVGEVSLKHSVNVPLLEGNKRPARPICRRKGKVSAGRAMYRADWRFGADARHESRLSVQRKSSLCERVKEVSVSLRGETPPVGCSLRRHGAAHPT